MSLTDEDKKVGESIAEGWLDGLRENSQEEIEAAINAFGWHCAVLCEVFRGDGAVMRLAETFRETADVIETKLGQFIAEDQKRARQLGKWRKMKEGATT